MLTHSVPQRVLVVKLADLGDALSITPALGVVRRGLPETVVHVLTTAAGAQALASLPLHDGLILFAKHRFDVPRSLVKPANLRTAWQLWRELRRGRYDTVLLLHHLTTRFGVLKYRALCQATGAGRVLGLDNGRGSFLTERVKDHGYGVWHESDYWLQVVGLLGIDTGNAVLRGPAQPFALPECAPHARARIALHPGSGGYAPARRWPVTRWAALADAMIEEDVEVVLVGGPEEATLRRTMLQSMRHAQAVLDLGGKTSVAELGGLLKQCDLFAGSDSGVLHLAAASGIPVVAPYGPTDPRAWGPWSGMPWRVTERWPNGVRVLAAGPHRTLQAGIACSPCINRGHVRGTPQGCPDRTCLERISVEQMLAVVRARLLTREVSACA